MDIDEIDKGLLVANRQTAADAEVLAARGVTHVLSLVPLASHVAERLAASVRISVQPMLDDNQEMLLLRLNALFAFLDEAAAMPGAVTLVHCHAGSSRSGAVVIAFLMRTRRMSFADALRFVRARRPCVDPNEGARTCCVRAQLLVCL